MDKKIYYLLWGGVPTIVWLLSEMLYMFGNHSPILLLIGLPGFLVYFLIVGDAPLPLLPNNFIFQSAVALIIGSVFYFVIGVLLGSLYGKIRNSK